MIIGEDLSAPFLQPTFNYSHRPTSTGRSTFATEPRPYHTLRELELYRITRSKEYEKWYNKPDRDRRSVQIKVQFMLALKICRN